jgi:hypothetical protein
MKLSNLVLCFVMFFGLLATYFALAESRTQSVKTVAGSLVVTSCGALGTPGPYQVGTYVPQTVDVNGQNCATSGGAGGGTAISLASITVTPLDVASVTTGGTAVTALAAGKRTKGGFLLNPSGATVALCINEAGATASGTASAGSLVCIQPGNSFNLAPSALAVSVVTSDSAHSFAGEGYN